MQRKISDKTTLYFDEGKIIIATAEDVEPLVEANNTQRNDVKPKGHMWEVARLPTTLYHRLREQFGPYKHNPTDWKRWLNDPDNRFFRTWHGRV